jgi:hypothetical protein
VSDLIWQHNTTKQILTSTENDNANTLNHEIDPSIGDCWNVLIPNDFVSPKYA